LIASSTFWSGNCRRPSADSSGGSGNLCCLGFASRSGSCSSSAACSASRPCWGGRWCPSGSALVVEPAVPAHADRPLEIDRSLRMVFGGNDIDGNGRFGTGKVTHFVHDLFAATDNNGASLMSRWKPQKFNPSSLPLAQRHGQVGRRAARCAWAWRRRALGRRKAPCPTEVQNDARGELFAVPGARQTAGFAQFKRTRGSSASSPDRCAETIRSRQRTKPFRAAARCASS
jgi:hypothetical protein